MKNQFKSRVFTFCILLSMLLGAVGMPTLNAQAATTVALDGTPDSNTFASTTVSLTHTTGTGANRLLLVGLSYNCSTASPVPTVSAVTYTPSGGSALNLTLVMAQDSGSKGRVASIYYLPPSLNPPSGTAGTVTVTFSSSCTTGIVVGAANFSGVDQTTPLGTANGNVGASVSTLSTTVTTTGTELVFDDALAGYSSDPTLKVNSTQTSLWNAFKTNTAGGGSIKDAASNTSVTMNWTRASAAGYMALVAVPINPAPAGPTHNLTIAVSPDGAGTTNPAVGTTPYTEGIVVPITATVANGYIFDHWDGDCTGSGSCSVTMSTDKIVTAYFVTAHSLTVAVNPPGAGTTSPAIGTHPYAAGSSVPVTASAATGYTFHDWSGDCTGSGNCTVTMNGDKNVTANFSINQYALNVTFSGSGSGNVTSSPTGIDCSGAPCSHSFDYNTVVNLSEGSTAGSQFAGWGGDCSGTGACSVTMTAIHNVTATFNTIPTYTLTVAVDPNGSGTTDPAIGDHVYNEGTVAPIAATAASGYVFDHWTGDMANANSASTTVTMSANKTVTAFFTPSPIGYIGDVGQSVYQDASGTSLALTVGSAGVLAGKTIIIGFASRGVQNYLAPTITDSKGNAYSIAVCSVAYSHGREYLAYAPVTTALVSGDLITLTSSPAVTNRVMVASVFSGLLNVSPLDQSLYSTECSSNTSATASNNATVGPTGATAQANELVIGLIAAEDASGTTPLDAGLGTWLNDFKAGATQKSQNTNSYRWRVSMGRYLASSIGTFTAAQTYTNAPYWAASIATFKADTRSLTINAGTGGSITAPAGAPPFTYVKGAIIPITAAASTGYHFVNWTGDVSSLANANSASTTITMNSDYTITANFAPDTVTHTLTFSAGTGGSITAPATSPSIYNSGDVVNITASPNTGYHFVNWTGNVSTVADVNALSTTITMNANYVITANFAIDTHTLTYNAGPGGTITTPATSPSTHNYGELVTIIAVPSNGYHFVNWTGNVGTVASVNTASTTITMNGDSTITANFAIDTHTLTYNAGAGGTITAPATSPSTHNYGELVTIIAAPSTGYHFVNWTGNVGTVASVNTASTTITMNGDYTITANFALDTITHTLTYSAGTGGSITSPPSSPTTFNSGAVVSIIASANPGYHFVNWTGDVSTVADVNALSTTITMNANYVITANFALDTTHSIPLASGWNLISFKVHPADTGIAAVLSSINTNYDLVYAFDSTGAHSASGNWVKYDPTGPEYQNTLSNLDEKMGIWIHMTAADTLDVTGSTPVTTTINLSTAAGGWNLVAYPSSVNRSLPAALTDNGVGTDFSLIFGYHATDTADPWKLFDRTAPAWANDLTDLTPGWGYWIRVSADRPWGVGY